MEIVEASQRFFRKDMRIPVLSILIVLITFYPSFAQTQIGLLVGGNLSNIKTHGYCFGTCDLANQNRIILSSFQIGLTANHQFSKGLTLDTDLLLARRGYEEYRYYPAGDKMLLNYLSIPLTLNKQIEDSPFDFTFGLETAYLLAAWTITNGQKEDARDLWRDLDIGANIGLAYRFRPNLKMKIGYYLGFFSVDGSENNGATLRMRSFQIAVNYEVFQLKNKRNEKP